MTENMAARGEGLAGLVAAATRIDWMQVLLNLMTGNETGRDGQPCFFVGGGHFCLRAKFWAGHDDMHKFVSLETALEAAAPAGTARKPSYEECRKLINALAGDWHNNLTNVEVYALADKYLVPFLAALATPSPQAPETMCGCTRGLDGTLLTMNCERHKRLVVPAATQEQPAGSGAKLPNVMRVGRSAAQEMHLAGSMYCSACNMLVEVGTDDCPHASGMAGSPRKVGEDGARRVIPSMGEHGKRERRDGLIDCSCGAGPMYLSHWAEHLANYSHTDHVTLSLRDFGRLASALKSAGFKMEHVIGEPGRSSSVPVGEQKQGEGV